MKQEIVFQYLHMDSSLIELIYRITTKGCDRYIVGILLVLDIGQGLSPWHKNQSVTT